MSTIQKQIVTLNRKRGYIKKRLTEFSSFIKELQKSSDVERVKIIEVECRLNRLQGCVEDFQAIQEQIDELSEREEQGTEVDEFEKSYYEIVAVATQFIEEAKGKSDNLKASSVSINNNDEVAEKNVRLPQIPLPTFSGKYTDWLSYRDVYEALIHNTKMANVQKFQYLKASLEGDAKKVINSIAITGANYELAWSTVCKRFENKRLLIHNHIRALFDLPVIVEEKPSAFREMLDAINNHMHSLEMLGEPIEHWDSIMVYVITSKFDSTTARDWEAEIESTQKPKLLDLTQFIQKRAEMLETLNLTRLAVNNSSKKRFQGSGRALLASGVRCYYYDGAHAIYSCNDFLALSLNDKRKHIKLKKLCLNCLRTGHEFRDCTSGACRRCGKRHNTLLHEEQKQNETQALARTSETQASVTEEEPKVLYSNNTYCNAILSTAQVTVCSKKQLKCRLVLDSGSQSNFITKSLANKIGAHVKPSNIQVCGISDLSMNIEGKCEITIKSLVSSFEITIQCHVINQIANHIPGLSINTINIPNGVKLADPDYYKSGPIDLLLGNGIFWGTVLSGNTRLERSNLILQNTLFGWIIAGPIAYSNGAVSRSNCMLTMDTELQIQLGKFWELDDYPAQRYISEEDKECEAHFTDNYRRDIHGRFIVKIPFKDPTLLLGDSKTGALKRFYNLERKLQQNPNLRDKYNIFMKEYEDLGHMSKVDDNDSNQPRYYIPHRAVINDSSLTTKLRVVYDASFPSSSGYSLNNLQYVGPTLQSDLLSIFLRFRQHPVAISADITKMYRQILVQPEQRNLQLILWREDPSQPVATYQLNTVTYGMTSSSFLAIRCLQQLALDAMTEFPVAAKTILDSFYVDDLLGGANSVEEASLLCKQISIILESGCFPLRKWLSNKPEALAEMIDGSDETFKTLTIGEGENAKTLGLYWASRDDNLVFNVNANASESITKRVILSTISQIFDPLGLLGATIVLFKIMMQLLWKEGLDWDDEVPQHIQNSWMLLQPCLSSLSTIKIPRCAILECPVNIQLHGLSDASEKAYGGCVYIRSENSEGRVQVTLLCSKSKVAPLKTITMPRLELCAALVLSKLINKVLTSLSLKFHKVKLWCDSQIVLAWLKTPPNLLKIFVANRITQIQQLTNNITWSYVPSAENPADLVSRGVLPAELAKNMLWWQGPCWLNQNEEFWPNTFHQQLDAIPELRPQQTVCVASVQPIIEIRNFSSYLRLRRVIGWCLRFAHNARQTISNRERGPLRVPELRNAMIVICKMAQNESYKQELHDLEKDGKVQANSTILPLSPYIDTQGLIRVGGRLSHSDLSADAQHPIILDNKHYLTYLLFRDKHVELGHAGVSQMLYAIRDNFWPVRARNTAKRVVRECFACFRANPHNKSPPMGQLPRKRVVPSYPFAITGIDYAGPFQVKANQVRSNKTTKCYIAIFVCFSSKAIHIEAVNNLTTEAFIAALRRFISRRGRPNTIYSDNAKNFVGAQRELGQLLSLVQGDTDKLINVLAENQIEWRFIPPRSPHFGGLWEAAVKSAKFHIKRILSGTLLTFEGMTTLLCQIEAILNCRPLSPLSNDPKDLEPLTPSHFLIGRKITSIPEPSLEEINPGRLSNYQRIQRHVQDFWARWSREYLQQLQPRSKWRNSTPATLNVGDLVLLAEDCQPPLTWPLARVIELFPGEDGHTRVATVQTTKGTYKRAVAKLYPLPLQHEKTAISDGEVGEK